jgi:hypothetical protein
MKATAKRIAPEEYILSVLSPEERLGIAFKIAGEAFKGTKLTIKDIEDAVKRLRKKNYKK